jgi:acyl transferase domain-containing protein
MGSALYKSVPLFQGIVDQCHSFLVKSGFAGVMQFIMPDENRSILPEMEELEVYQSAIFALEYALSQLWISWGVTPAIVVGHR